MSRKQGARAGVVAFLAAAAGAVGWGLWRTRGRGARAHEPAEWACECGQRFRFSGAGRHRVYWTEGAPAHEPVVGDRCPSCDRPLPGGREAVVPAMD
ncbi:hypothetical protein [Capillimicrobium parvum]|uniref:Uncharacterized protein n=1 Tax=Capillimicrobium parvum TaxID=2884022 RepID=A0A9E7C067_9ACTN|nr:hypothetical protein [Capillimicrobium parvum]UGS35309.1 hypothetical protein DSM104329_01696 [Capillimicrobium parvum]